MSKVAWRAGVDDVLANRGRVKESLLPCLEAVQESCACVPGEAIAYLRDRLGIPSVDIYGTITFYGMLTTTEQGKYVIRLCDSLPCRLAGSQDMLEVVERELGIAPGETTADKKFSLDVVACLGLCDLAPAMMVNEETHGNLTAQKIADILAGLKGR